MKAEIAEKIKKRIRKTVSVALENRRQTLVFEVARKLDLSFKNFTIREQDSLEENDWLEVESLSRLRALVGGRFQNLKDRWVAAGFPLREHRGDRSGKKKINQKGWQELSSWIHKQGFEIRLADEDSEFFFEIKKVN